MKYRNLFFASLGLAYVHGIAAAVAAALGQKAWYDFGVWVVVLSVIAGVVFFILAAVAHNDELERAERARVLANEQARRDHDLEVRRLHTEATQAQLKTQELAASKARDVAR